MPATTFRMLADAVRSQCLSSSSARTPAHFPEIGIEAGGFLEDHDQLCLAGRREVEIRETSPGAPVLSPRPPGGALAYSANQNSLQLALNQRVPGSSPGAPTKLFRHLAQRLASAGVTSPRQPTPSSGSPSHRASCRRLRNCDMATSLLSSCLFNFLTIRGPPLLQPTQHRRHYLHQEDGG